MKILYAGSPQAAADTLNILLEGQKEYGFEVSGVLSNPPSSKGRHKELTPTPVAELAQKYGIPVFTPEHLDAAAREEIKTIEADLLISFAYGHIFGPKFLSLFKLGGINLHPSLLPKYRGCTPVPAAIINRDNKTAVSIQTLALKMDEGDILLQEEIELKGIETGESLLNTSAQIGGQLLCQLLKEVVKNKELPKGNPQKGEPSYTRIITKNDGKIDWEESASTIEAKIRAYYPEPGCWCIEKELPLRILKADFISEADERSKKYERETAGKVLEFVKSEGIYIKTKSGILVVKELQRQGKKAMLYKDFMNGARDFIGSVLQ
ncbi:MAG: methionyl-tRNA formyltransferase [Treponema sp.]|nr:methionyl-tRNA formyltransferase [Treponema sp.]